MKVLHILAVIHADVANYYILDGRPPLLFTRPTITFPALENYFFPVSNCTVWRVPRIRI